MTTDDPLQTRRDAIAPVTADSSAVRIRGLVADPGVGPPPPLADGRTGELPLELTSFVDRRAETAEVKTCCPPVDS